MNGKCFQTFVFLLSMLVFGSCSSLRAPVGSSNNADIVIRHHSGSGFRGNVFRADPDSVVRIRVEETNLRCVYFDTSTREVASKASMDFDDFVEFHIPFYEDPLDVVITPIKRAKTPPICEALSLTPWTIRIEPFSWELDVSGAFSGDQLVDERWLLEKQPVSDGAPTEYKAVRHAELEDDYEYRSAVMLHLGHNSPSRLRVFGLPQTYWAPVSFGIGTSDASRLRWYLGTSVRFSKAMFLTAGYVFGPVDTIPDGLAANPVTTDANALSQMGSRNDKGVFFALSLSLADVDLGYFRDRAAQYIPKAAKSSGSQETEEVGEAEEADPPQDGTPSSQTGAAGLTVRFEGNLVVAGIATDGSKRGVQLSLTDASVEKCELTTAEGEQKTCGDAASELLPGQTMTWTLKVTGNAPEATIKTGDQTIATLKQGQSWPSPDEDSRGRP